MERKNYNLVFSAFILFSVVLIILWKLGSLNFFSGIISKIFQGPRSLTISKITPDKNLDLIKISESLSLEKLQKENEALRDQFSIANPSSQNLLPAKIIGAPTFIPSVTFPDYFILNKGEKDGVKVGAAVVVRDNLLGQISQVNSYSSKVVLINSKTISFPGKLNSSAVGVVRGTGDGIEIDNVLLSEDLKKDDVILTKGNQDISGIGIPPDVVVGKVISVDHDPSALFQKAKLQSLVDFTKINMVFVVIK